MKIYLGIVLSVFFGSNVFASNSSDSLVNEVRKALGPAIEKEKALLEKRKQQERIIIFTREAMFITIYSDGSGECQYGSGPLDFTSIPENTFQYLHIRERLQKSIVAGSMQDYSGFFIDTGTADTDISKYTSDTQLIFDLCSIVKEHSDTPILNRWWKSTARPATRAYLGADKSVRLPPGFSENKTGTIDSRRGEISKDNSSFVITYDIGVSSGLHMSPEKRGECVWFKEQLIRDQKYYIGMEKKGADKILTISIIPQEGVGSIKNAWAYPANFWVTVKTEEDIADAFLIATTYLHTPPSTTQKKIASADSALLTASAYLQAVDISRYDMSKPESIEEIQSQGTRAWRVSWKLKNFTGKGGQLLVIVNEYGICELRWGE